MADFRSLYSDYAAFTTSTLNPVRTITASPSPNGGLIGWSAPVGGVVTATDVYEVFVGDAASPNYVVTPTGANTNGSVVIAGLLSATTYNIRVRVRRTSGGQVSYSDFEERSFTTAAPVGVVSNIRRKAGDTANPPTFVWDITGNVQSYSIEVSVNGGASTTATSAVREFTLPNELDDGDVAVVSVTPIFLAVSGSSVSHSYTQPYDLAAPTNLRVVERRETAADVAWNSVDNATGYDVYLDGTRIAQVTTTQHTITGLVTTDTYQVQVRATRSGAEDGDAAFVAIGTLLGDLNLRTTNIGTTNATITWDAITGATSYQVLLDGSVLDNTTNTTYTYTAIEDGKQYTAEVRATVGDETVTDTADFTTLPLLPSVPTGLAASNITDSSVTITWDAAANADRYLVYLDGDVIAMATDTTYTYTLLQQGTTYSFTVASFRDYDDLPAGMSAQSSAVSATTERQPSAPVIEVTNLTDEGFDLSWSADDADSYELEIDGVVTTPDNPTSHSLDGLDEYEEVLVKVTAINNWGKVSSERTIRTLFLVPGGITLTNDISEQTSITWNWTAAQDATRYRIVRSDGEEVFVTDLTYTWSSLRPGRQYSLTVTPQREYSPGLFSSGASTTLAVQTAPPVLPGLIQLQIGDVDGDSIEVEYTTGNNTDGVVFSISPADADAQTITTTSNASGTITFDGLKGNTQYQIEATPSNGGENGTPSFITARTALSAPTNLTTQNIGPGQVLVKWDEVDGAESYTTVFYVTSPGARFRTTATFPENQIVLLNLINNISWTIEVRANRGGVQGEVATITAIPSQTASAAITGRLATLPAPAPLSRFHTFPEEDILNATIAFMPPGLPCEADSNHRTWLDTVAYGEQVKVGDIQNLLRELYPATSEDAIADWERSVFSDDCYTPSAALFERRLAVVLKLRQRGGNTLSYLRGTAQEYGFGGVTTEEDFAFRAGVNVAGDKLGADQVVIGWSTKPATTNDDAVEQLACILQETKLLHVKMFINNDNNGTTRTEV